VSTTPAVASGAAAGLRLFVRCGSSTLAIDTGPIERVLLTDETGGLIPVPAEGPAPDSWLGVLDAGGRYAAWDLGRMLGGAATARAWILLSPKTAWGGVPCALRVDACVQVARLVARTLPLPPGLFARRPGALRAAFRLRADLVAADVDLPRLFLPDELAWGGEALARLGGPGA
jgi:hypothetical protein